MRAKEAAESRFGVCFICQETRPRTSLWDNLSGHSQVLPMMPPEHSTGVEWKGSVSPRSRPSDPVLGRSEGATGHTRLLGHPHVARVSPEYKVHAGFPTLWIKKRERERECKILITR